MRFTNRESPYLFLFFARLIFSSVTIHKTNTTKYGGVCHTKNTLYPPSWGVSCEKDESDMTMMGSSGMILPENDLLLTICD